MGRGRGAGRLLVRTRCECRRVWHFSAGKRVGRRESCSGRGSRRGNGVTALRFPVDVRLCLSQDIELLKMAARAAAAASSPASSPVCALSLLKLVKILKGLPGGRRGSGCYLPS